MPSIFTKGTVSGKELRLRAAIEHIKAVHVVAPKGNWVGDRNNTEVGELERKIIIHHIPRWPYYLRAIPLFFWGYYWAKKSNADIIEAESPIISGPAAVLIGILQKKPTCIEIRATYSELIKIKVLWIPLNLKKRLLKLISTFTFRKASKVIANSNYYREKLLRQGFASIVINPGIQLELSKQLTHANNIDQIIIGYLGRIEEEKGLRLLLEAFKNLLTNSAVNDNICLLIAGEGSLKIEFFNLVKNSPILRNRVIFMGFQNSHKFLSQITFLVNPTTVIAPLEMVNLEAAFFGKPVISFGDEKMPETVIDGETGIKVKTKSAQALAKAIISLIKDPQLYKQLKQHAPLLAQEYSFTTQVEKLQRLYAQL
jgi:glycosyltransferase involved in cell wall biosynthesis